MTLEEMRRNVRFALGLREPEELPIIDQKINDGVMDVLRRTGCAVLCFDADTPDNEGPAGAWRRDHARACTSPATGCGWSASPTLRCLATRGAFAQVGNVLIFGDVLLPGREAPVVRRAPPDQARAIPTTRWRRRPSAGSRPSSRTPSSCTRWPSLPTSPATRRRSAAATTRSSTRGRNGREGRLAEIRRQVNKMSGLTLGQGAARLQLLGPVGEEDGQADEGLEGDGP